MLDRATRHWRMYRLADWGLGPGVWGEPRIKLQTFNLNRYPKLKPCLSAGAGKN